MAKVGSDALPAASIARKGLTVNRLHGVAQIAHIPKTFGAKPGCVLPVEAFAKGVVWCRDVPVTIHIRRVNGALRPIRLPLRHLDPHHRCKNHGEQGFQHLLNAAYRNFTRIGLRTGIVIGINDDTLKAQAGTGFGIQ